MLSVYEQTTVSVLKEFKNITKEIRWSSVKVECDEGSQERNKENAMVIQRNGR